MCLTLASHAGLLPITFPVHSPHCSQRAPLNTNMTLFIFYKHCSGPPTDLRLGERPLAPDSGVTARPSALPAACHQLPAHPEAGRATREPPPARLPQSPALAELASPTTLCRGDGHKLLLMFNVSNSTFVGLPSDTYMTDTLDFLDVLT